MLGNYDEYVKDYEGVMPESKFDKLAFEANKYIEKYTQNRANSEVKEVRQCFYEIIEILKDYEELRMKNRQTKNKKSEAVGKWSITYSDNTSKDLIKEKETEIFDIIKLYLSNIKDSDGVFLLYRGN